MNTIGTSTLNTEMPMTGPTLSTLSSIFSSRLFFWFLVSYVVWTHTTLFSGCIGFVLGFVFAYMYITDSFTVLVRVCKLMIEEVRNGNPFINSMIVETIVGLVRDLFTKRRSPVNYNDVLTQLRSPCPGGNLYADLGARPCQQQGCGPDNCQFMNVGSMTPEDQAAANDLFSVIMSMVGVVPPPPETTDANTPSVPAPETPVANDTPTPETTEESTPSVPETTDAGSSSTVDITDSDDETFRQAGVQGQV